MDNLKVQEKNIWDFALQQKKISKVRQNSIIKPKKNIRKVGHKTAEKITEGSAHKTKTPKRNIGRNLLIHGYPRKLTGWAMISLFEGAAKMVHGNSSGAAEI